MSHIVLLQFGNFGCLFAECDHRFFSELTKDASEILGCLRSRVRRLLHLHYANGLQGYIWRLWRCFSNQGEMMQEGRLLIDYVLMNAIAIRKILKKYDKVCVCSAETSSLPLDRVLVESLTFIDFRFIALSTEGTSSQRCNQSALSFYSRPG